MVFYLVVLLKDPWYGSGSGSADPYDWLTSPDQDSDPATAPAPDPALFVSSFAYDFLRVHLHQPSKIKSHKEVTKH